MGQFFNSSGLFDPAQNGGERKWQSNISFAFEKSRGYKSYGKLIAPQTDYKTIVHAHTFIENSTYVEFAPELIYSLIKKKLPGEAKYSNYDPESRRKSSHVSSDEGIDTCSDSLSTSSILSRVEDKLQKDKLKEVVEPLKPFTHFLGQVTNSPLQYRLSRRGNDTWRSFRPCREFMEKRTCRYGITCRFSHGFSSSEITYNKPPPRKGNNFAE